MIGARGAGKSTVGPLVAALLGAIFEDLDALLAPGVSAGELLERVGEARFREIELDALRDALARPGPRVIAAGGGAVTLAPARALLQREARAIWLRAPASVLSARVEADPTPRPALLGGDAVEEMTRVLAARRAWFEAVAFAAVDADAVPETVARRVLAALSE